MQTLIVLVVVTLSLSPVLLGGLAWAFQSPRLAAYRITPGPGMQVAKKNRLRSMTVTSVLSLGTVIGTLVLLHPWLFSTASHAAWVVAVEALGIVLVYDFVYYGLHRAMHHPRLLKAVHGVHHRARNPSALESLYQHPAELMAGLAVLFSSTWIVGRIAGDGVDPIAFGVMFFVYSMVNILVHSGLDSKSPLLAPIDWLTRKHHAHHHDDPDKNFSTMTPLPDLLFGTR